MAPGDPVERGSTSDRRAQLFQRMDDIRDRVPRADLPTILNHFKAQGEQLSATDILHIEEVLSQRGPHSAGAWVLPAWVIRFIGELVRSRKAENLLDIDSGYGLLGGVLTDELNQSVQVDVIARNAVATEIFAAMDSIVRRLQIGTLESAANHLSPPYDAIITFVGLGGAPESRTYRSESGEITVRDAPESLVLLDASPLLALDGFIAALLPPRFIWEKRTSSARQTLSDFGLHISAMLRLRPGVLPTTPISLELVLIERQEYPSLFVAEVPEDSEAQKELVARLASRSEGPAPTQGRLVDPQHYRGIDALDAEETVRVFSRRRGLNAVPFGEAIREIRRPRRRGDDFEPLPEHSDAVYLPEMASTHATTSQAELPDRLRSYFQLLVNSDVVLPWYLANLLNTPHGQLIRKSAMAGTSISRIDQSTLQESTLYLPPLDQQAIAMRAMQELNVLRSVLNELENSIWDQPRQVQKAADAIKMVNHEDRFEDWVETLPFPLASILRAYYTIDESDKDKYQRLLHFFEAVAAFCATIHLSACRPRPELWESSRAQAIQVMEKEHLSARRPTFGLWNVLLDAFAPPVRRLVNGREEERALVQSLYCLPVLDPLIALCSSKLLSILQRANVYRIRWTGHGGGVSQAEARERHAQVSELLSEFRRLINTQFWHYELVEPMGLDVLPDRTLRYRMRRVMGSNPLLVPFTADLTDLVVSHQLCFLSPGYHRAMSLIQIFKVRDAPQPASYFFNRLEGESPFFVTYGLAEESAISDATMGDELRSIIADLSANRGGVPDAN